MQSLMVDQPADPINYMIDLLQDPPKNKIFVVGPPGLKTKNEKLILELCDHLNYSYISSGDLLRKEVSKKTELGY